MDVLLDIFRWGCDGTGMGPMTTPEDTDGTTTG
jgi:hypothetical protein